MELYVASFCKQEKNHKHQQQTLGKSRNVKSNIYLSGVTRDSLLSHTER